MSEQPRERDIGLDALVGAEMGVTIVLKLMACIALGVWIGKACHA